ncbi:MAG: type II toxin-antitoxin system MqsA family antitoxin [Pseudomonas sp.]
MHAFSRWENGKMRPPVALIELFKLLDRRPELFEEIRTP